jgi:hypothetical protein
MGANSTVQVELLLVNLSSSRRVEEDNTMTEDEITARLPSLVNDMFDNLACHNAIDLLRGEQTLNALSDPAIASWHWPPSCSRVGPIT